MLGAERQERRCRSPSPASLFGNPSSYKAVITLYQYIVNPELLHQYTNGLEDLIEDLIVLFHTINRQSRPDPPEASPQETHD